MVAWNRDCPWLWPETETETVERPESCRLSVFLTDRGGRRVGLPDECELAATLDAMDATIPTSPDCFD